MIITDFQQDLPANFHDSSRVWIYQCNRAFTQNEITTLQPVLQQFVQNWQAHGIPVKGYANIFFNQFIILMADETATGVSGCSTDSSVRMIKDIETRLTVDLFNRQLLAFVQDNSVKLISMAQLQPAAASQVLHPETLYFNNTILTKKELASAWIIPIKKSWLANKISWPALV